MTHRIGTVWLTGVVLTLAWGVFAFGSPWAWAYGPLLVASATLGAAGLILGSGPLPWLVTTGLLLIGFAASLQLLPLSIQMVERLSPNAIAIHHIYQLPLAGNLTDRLTLSIDPSRTRLGLGFLSAFGLLLLGTARMLSRDTARTLVVAIAVLGVIVALAGIIPHATFSGKVYGFFESRGGNPFGPFINKNHFAGWMLMALPVAIGLFSATVYRGVRNIGLTFRDRIVWLSTAGANKVLLLGFLVLTMTLALVLALSKSGMISFAGALGLASSQMARRPATRQQRAFVSGSLAFVAVVVVLWVGLDLIVSRFDTSNPIVAMSGRPAIWRDTIRIAGDFPLVGTGLNTYGVSTLFYQTALPGEHLREAHSDYLQLAAEGGILLAVPIVLTLAAFVRTVRQRLSNDVGSIWWIRMGAITGLLAIAAQSLVEFSLQMPGNAVLCSVLCGIALYEDGAPVIDQPSV